MKWKRDFVFREAQALASALVFFSRFPWRLKNFDLARGVLYVPVVGYLLGMALYGLGQGLEDILDPWLLAALLLAFQYYCSNYFHFDGLLDAADALAAPVSQAKRLKILKTPEVGVLGFLFGFFFLLTEFLLVAALVRADLWWGLALRPVAGRLVMGVVAFLGRPAKREGLGHLFLETSLSRLFFSQLFWAPIFYGFPLAALGALLTAPLMAWFWQDQFGGLTGDLLGASEELGEWAFSLALVVGLGLGAW